MPQHTGRRSLECLSQHRHQQFVPRLDGVVVRDVARCAHMQVEAPAVPRLHKVLVPLRPQLALGLRRLMHEVAALYDEQLHHLIRLAEVNGDHDLVQRLVKFVLLREILALADLPLEVRPACVDACTG